MGLLQGYTICLWPSSIHHTTQHMGANPALIRQTACFCHLLWGLFCYSDIELVFFYFLASLPDVQLVFGGRVALIAVTAMTAVLTIPAKKSKLKNVEVEVLVGLRGGEA